MSSFLSRFMGRLSPASPRNLILIIKAPALGRFIGFGVCLGVSKASRFRVKG